MAAGTHGEGEAAAALPASWSGEAFNPVPESENRIHGDEVAQAYGFRGGLVPGVVVSAYLTHPAAVAWGREWLERGSGHATVHSPVYDRELFQVEVGDATADAYEARLVDPTGKSCATAEVGFPAAAPEPPVRRGDPPVGDPSSRLPAARESFERLREEGLRSLRLRWAPGAEITGYLRERSAEAPVFRETGVASTAFVLALSNWALAANVRLEAWLHLETHFQHFRCIEPGARVAVETAVADLFEKRGHHFVDLDVGVFSEADDAALAQVRLRAIYLLRGAAGA